VTGFLAGAAVDVVIGELPKLTGTDAEGETAWGELASWIRSLGDVSGTTVLVGVAALAVILGLRFSAPRVPGALVLVVGGLLATPVFNLDAHGVALVGNVPRGLPTPGLPDLGGGVPRDAGFPGYAVVRLDGGLFFATAEALDERLRTLVGDADPPLRAVVLDMEGVDFVDPQGAAALAEILDFTESAVVRMSLARVKPAVARVLGSDG
jgi:anti-anti-sigma factor